MPTRRGFRRAPVSWRVHFHVVVPADDEGSQSQVPSMGSEGPIRALCHEASRKAR